MTYVAPTERVLDRLPEFDARSREYPVRALIAARGLPTRPRSYTWSIPPMLTWFPLDQGTEGACVGFAFTHELAARPVVHRDVDAAWARLLYHQARTVDEWPGEDYEGTSVLAGAKVLKAAGRCVEYRWCFGVDDVLLTVSRLGPVVLGIDWLEGMDYPSDLGIINATGPVRGGHAIMCNGVNLRRGLVTLTNSWGAGYGRGGRVYLPIPDLERLLGRGGEACALIRR